jgi:hypothetical protein
LDRHVADQLGRGAVARRVEAEDDARALVQGREEVELAARLLGRQQLVALAALDQQSEPVLQAGEVL